MGCPVVSNQYFKKTLVSSVFLFLSSQVYASGFQIHSQSATGIGRAFAGDAVIADNASVMARNAAAMSLFDKTSLSLGLNFIKADISVKNASYDQNIFGYQGDSNYKDAGGIAYIPNIHIIFPLNDRFAVGFDIYSNFASGTNFDNSFTASEIGGKTNISSINLGLALSYRINSQWSIGGGLDVIYGTGEVQRAINVYAPDGTIVASPKVLEIDTDGFGLGYNLGSVFELDENNRFGLSYHFSPRLKTKGDIYFSQPTSVNDTLYMNLPDTVEFSGYHRIKNTKYAAHYSVQWTGWSTFDALDSTEHGKIGEYRWNDTYRFALGGSYYLSRTWTLRAGYMYDQSAQKEITSVSVPDSDRDFFSSGFTYHFSENANIDFGATYLLGRDVEVKEDIQGISSFTGTSRVNAILLALQYSYQY